MRTSLSNDEKALKVIKNIVLAASLAAAFLASGCATNDAVATSNEDIASREYPTGSSIPRKTKTAQPGTDTYNRDALERAQQDRTQGVTPSAGARAGGGM
jgi:hypothetical protein